MVAELPCALYRTGVPRYKARGMSRSAASIVLAALLVTACTVHLAPRARDAGEMSGFLDDYSLLRPGGPGDLPLVYRNPKAQWTAYRKVILEPVTLWRSGAHSLDAIGERDLLHLVSDFETAARRRLGRGFELVEKPSPGTLLLRLAITEARAADPVLDVLTATGDDESRRLEGDLPSEMRRFIESAAIEGEIRDAETNAILVQGIDRRRGNAPPIETWQQLDGALQSWIDRMCSRLEARTSQR